MKIYLDENNCLIIKRGSQLLDEEKITRLSAGLPVDFKLIMTITKALFEELQIEKIITHDKFIGNAYMQYITAKVIINRKNRTVRLDGFVPAPCMDVWQNLLRITLDYFINMQEMYNSRKKRKKQSITNA